MMPESKYYYLDGRLLRVANEYDRHITYTHVMCAGDRVLSWHQSLADAQDWAEKERQRLRREQKKLNRIYERRSFVTDPAPDAGTAVRLPAADLMYPTRRDLRKAVEDVARQIESVHVRALEVRATEKTAPERRTEKEAG